ncbi:enoyl-CoA hydratase/isomerase family protein [uncultured Pseudoteredinibacter sp.]|uniref:enoyl-CoA hydratase/isomerase family protein n=1 Tax=uncultured Pseudoteredinibacter sp. TaxID=1641701 RepID=UPI0026162021|nr:enoyl-CoA hydratase/isomerase family protein [uncultured Pseudoteredinibacter sp.]
MDNNDVIISYEQELVRVHLNRPKQRNALNDSIRQKISALLDELMERPDTRVLLFSGEGESFCSGADLKTTSYPKVEGSWSQRRNRTSTWQRVLEQLDRIPQVTVASMQGFVIGGGALLATACDFRLVADNAVLSIPEVAMGIPNVWNGTPLLVREVGLPVARDWVMTAKRVNADELLKVNWAQRRFQTEQLAKETQAFIEELLEMPAASLAMTRSMISALARSQSGMQLGWADADLQQWSFTEEEYQQSALRYLEKLKK